MPPIPRRPSPPPAERDVLHAIRLALGQESDLVLWRLAQGAGILVQKAQLREIIEAVRAHQMDRVEVLLLALDRFARVGLVAGAADLIGILTSSRSVDGGPCETCRGLGLHPHDPFGGDCPTCGKGGRRYASVPWGRFFALEVKRPALPGRRGGKSSEEQRQWAALVRRMGGFVAEVDSVESATAALERARRGESQ